MWNRIRWAALVLCLSGLYACTAPDDRSNIDQAKRQPNTSIVHEQTKALEKAKSLARTLQKAEETRQQEMEAGTR
jgi:SOS-response transcriptional repressor LexA